MNLPIGFSLLLCSAATVVLMVGFNRSMLKRKRSAMFFRMLLFSVVIYLAEAATQFSAGSQYQKLHTVMHLLIYTGMGLLLFFYALYLIAIIEETESVLDILKPVLAILCVGSSAGWSIRLLRIQVFGIQETAEPMSEMLAVISSGFTIIVVVMFVILLVLHRRAVGMTNVFILLSFPLIPIVVFVLDCLFINAQISIRSILLPEILIYTRYHLETERKLEQKDTDLLKSEVRLMTGRMRPHYLYNVLSSIYYLCDRDPQQAKEAISLFSDYLRETMDAMKHQELVPLSWERQAIQNYLLLEKMRYGNKLHVETRSDLDDEDALIPPLSVQPLVENAIRHGLTRKKEGGLITIIGERSPGGEIKISVCDNGIGFDPALTEEGEGLLNVRERLRMLCDGKLTIKSMPGEGTTAVITLPQKHSNFN